MTMSIGGNATPPVTFNTPLGELTGAQVNNATLANPGAAAGAPPTPPGGAQAVNGTAAGGGAASPTGAAQAATGAKDAQPLQGGGPAGDQQAQLIEALKSLIAVLNQLVTALSAQVGGAQGGGPTDGKGGGPGDKAGGPPGKVDQSTGGPVQQTPMQMTPAQKGISQGGGGSMPGMPGMPGMNMPAAGAQPAAPTTGGGAVNEALPHGH